MGLFTEDHLCLKKDKYFRIGCVYPLICVAATHLTCLISRHMGVSVVDSSRGDIDKIISAVQETLAEARASKQ